MPANRFRQFGLRTLFITITLACILGAFVSQRFRGERFYRSVNMFGSASHPGDFARRLKLAIGELPGHQVTQDAQFKFERNFNVRTFEALQIAKPAEQVFARVTLSDGSASTVIGFWIYEREPRQDDRCRIEVTIVVLGYESYFDMQAGRHDQHERERHHLMNVVYPNVVESCRYPK